MPQTLSIISTSSKACRTATGDRPVGMAVGIGIATGPVLGGVLLDTSVGLGFPDQRAGDRDRRHPRRGHGCRSHATPRRPRSTTSASCCPSRAWCRWCTGSSRAVDGDSWLSLGVLGSDRGGLAILAGFAWYESRILHPSLDVGCSVTGGFPPRSGRSAGVLQHGRCLLLTSFLLRTSGVTARWNAGLLTVPFAGRQLAAAPRSAALVPAGTAPRRSGATGLFVHGIDLIGTPRSASLRRSGCWPPFCTWSGRGHRGQACRPPPPRRWTCLPRGARRRAAPR